MAASDRIEFELEAVELVAATPATMLARVVGRWVSTGDRRLPAPSLLAAGRVATPLDPVSAVIVSGSAPPTWHASFSLSTDAASGPLALVMADGTSIALDPSTADRPRPSVAPSEPVPDMAELARLRAERDAAERRLASEVAARVRAAADTSEAEAAVAAAEQAREQAVLARGEADRAREEADRVAATAETRLQHAEQERDAAVAAADRHEDDARALADATAAVAQAGDEVGRSRLDRERAVADLERTREDLARAREATEREAAARAEAEEAAAREGTLREHAEQVTGNRATELDELAT